MVGAFKRGRAKDPATRALLVNLFDLQVEYGFILTLKWIPTAANSVADAISRPSRESIVRLQPDAFRLVWDDLGPFKIDLMASTESAKHIPRSTSTSPFFSQYDCARSSGVDVLAQDFSRVPIPGEQAFGCCFPPPVMAGHIVEHLAECQAHDVIIVPDTRAYWFPLVQQATVQSLEVAPRAASGYFKRPSQDGVPRELQYPKWAMRAYEVDVRTCGK